MGDEVRESAFANRVKKNIEATSEVSSHGELSPRKRLELLFDEGSFKELQRLAMQAPLPFGKQKRLPGDGVVTAFGEVNGRPVAAVANVYNYMGGSIGVRTTKKIAELYRLAGEAGVPVVTFAESAGARLQEGVDIMEACGFEWSARAHYSGVIPQIAAVTGPCIGAAAVTSAMSDLVLWTKGGVLALAGPKVVQQATGEDLSYEEIGGASLHGRETGLCHRLCASEDELIEEIRTVLSLLPSNNTEEPPPRATNDALERQTPEIGQIIKEAGNKGFDCRQIITAIVDDGWFYEIAADYGPAVVTGFGYLGGMAVAVVANQSAVMSGALDTDACRKGARFFQMASAFNFPVISLVDVPGAIPTVGETKKGLLNALVRYVTESCSFKGPRVSLLLRKCFGGAYACLNPKSGGGDIVYSYEDSAVGIMSGKALASVLFKDKASEMLEKIGCRLDDPLLAAERGYIDDIISPAQTRFDLGRALRFVSTKRKLGLPPRRNHNGPL